MQTSKTAARAFGLIFIVYQLHLHGFTEGIRKNRKNDKAGKKLRTFLKSQKETGMVLLAPNYIPKCLCPACDKKLD